VKPFIPKGVLSAMKQWICQLLAHYEFKTLGLRQNPKFTSKVHSILERDFTELRRLLEKYAAENSWEKTSELFHFVVECGYFRALPQSQIPLFVAIDFECHVSTGEVWEFGLAREIGLFHEGRTEQGLIENSRGFPIKKEEVTEARILSTAATRKVVEQAIARPNVLLVGHNIKKFDVEVLKKLGLDVDRLAIIDTLELSLLVEPFKRFHRLDGCHRAVGDAQSALELLRNLDKAVMGFPLELLDVFASLAGNDVGFHKYFGYVRFRRGIRGEVETKPLNVARLERVRGMLEVVSGPEQVKDNLRAPAKSERQLLFDKVEAEDANTEVAHDISEPLRLSDFSEIRHTADTCYFLPSARITHWRKLLSGREHGIAGKFLALSETDRFVSHEFLSAAFEDNLPTTLSQFQRLYLASWFVQTRFELSSEIHPIVRADLPVLDFLLYYGSSPLPSAVVSERLRQYLGKIPCLVVDSHSRILPRRSNLVVVIDSLDPEESLDFQKEIDFRLGALCSLCGISDQTREWARSTRNHLLEFTKNRDIRSLLRKRSYRGCLLAPRDARDNLFSEILSALKNLRVSVEAERPIGSLWDSVCRDINAILAHLQDLVKSPDGVSDRLGIEFYGDLDQDVNVGIRIYTRVTKEERGREFDKLAARKIILTEGIVKCGLSRWYQALRDRPVRSVEDGELEISVEVVPEGAVPSIKSMNAMAAVKAHTAIRIKQDKERDCVLVGGSEEENSVCALVERQLEENAFHQFWYGSTSATWARIQGNEGIKSFYCDERAIGEINLLQGVDVVLTRLPFPSLSRALFSLALRGFEREGWNPLEILILPIMGIRLRRMISDIFHSNPTGRFYATDARFVERPFYRGLVEKACGALVRGNREWWLKRGIKRAEVSDQVAQELERRGVVGRRHGFRREEAEAALSFLIGKSGHHLKTEQLKVIESLVKGKNVLGILPTGYGKSVCFHVPALLMGEGEEALVVVVSPLRALMRNQVSELAKSGYPGATFLSGDLPNEEKWGRLRGVRMGWYSLLYIAPEQLRVRTVQNVLLERGIDLFVVDEAHCISEWGHEFRPDYLIIPEFLEALRERGHKPPVVAGFTATATQECSREIRKALNLGEEVRIPAVREEITCKIKTVSEGKKEKFSLESGSRWTQILAFLEKHAKEAGIIFVHRREEVERIVLRLQESPPKGWSKNDIAGYHAGMPDRKQIERRFLDPGGEDGIRLIVSTIAFGMGINKDNICFVIHHTAPTTIEDYYQQIGRAARGFGQRADTLCFYDEEEWNWKVGLGRPVTDIDCDKVWRLLTSKTVYESEQVFFPIKDAELSLNIANEDIRHCLLLLEREGAIKVLSAANRGKRIFQLLKGSVTNSHSDLQIQIVSQFTGREVLSEQDIWAGVRLSFLAFDLDRERFLGELAALSQGPDAPLKLLQECRLTLVVDPEDVTVWLTNALQDEFAFLRTVLSDFPELAVGRFVRFEGQKLCRLLDLSGLSFDELANILSSWATRGDIYLKQGFLSFVVKMLTPLPGEVEFKRHVDEVIGLLQEVIVSRNSETGEISVSSAEMRELVGKLVGGGVAAIIEDDEKGFGYEIQIIKRDFSPRRDIAAKVYGEYWKNKELRQTCMYKLLSSDLDSDGISRYVNEYFLKDQLAVMRQEQELSLRGNLNDRQWESVVARPDFLLINAAAGTGKTHTLATRVLHLHIQDLMPMERILVLTFSVTGMRQIRDRVGRLSEEFCGRPMFPPVMTFHAFALRIMRVLGASGHSWIDPNAAPVVPERYRRDDGFWVDVNPILRRHKKTIFDGIGGKFDVDRKFELFSIGLEAIRNGNVDIPEIVLTPEDCPSEGVIRVSDSYGELIELQLVDIKRVFARYYEILKQEQRIDFAGMVCEAIKALETEAGVLDRICDGVEHILVDEFQDTSRAQERLIRTVQERRSTGSRPINLDVVGDSDQTIFSFNGSSVENIVQFSERNKATFPDQETQRIDLTKNYRSRAHIISVANHCIQLNENRLEKDMVAHQKASPDDELVGLVEAMSLEEAVHYIVGRIEVLLNDGKKPESIAVIARKNSKMYPMLDLVRKAVESKMGKEYVNHSTGNRGQNSYPELVSYLNRQKKETLTVLVGKLLGKERTPQEDEWLFVLEGLEAEGIDKVEDAIASLVERDRLVPVERGIRFLTVHGAKGLEFQHVFLMYLGDRIFPDPRSDEEEERRLLYVGITRACESLVVVGKPGATPDFFQELSEAPMEALNRSSYSIGESGPIDIKVSPKQGASRHPDDDDFNPNAIDDILRSD